MSNYQRAEHTTRPLREEEKIFAEEHHYLMYRYMKIHELDPEEWYDILIIPYLNAVKKYHQYEKLQSLKFEQVFFRTLDNARSNYWRDMNRKKRCPEGGLFSYNAMLDDGYAEHDFLFCIVDEYTNVEKQVILKELFREFYNKCIYCDSDSWGDEHINKYLKCELDLLLEGYNKLIINKKTEKIFRHGYGADDLEFDVNEFRKIFKEVFSI